MPIYNLWSYQVFIVVVFFKQVTRYRFQTLLAPHAQMLLAADVTDANDLNVLHFHIYHSIVLILMLFFKLNSI